MRDKKAKEKEPLRACGTGGRKAWRLGPETDSRSRGGGLPESLQSLPLDPEHRQQ